jgi:hypothetical protein
MRYAYQAVERIPQQLREGVVYYSEEFELAALLCACGCGHRVTLLVPDSHQVTSQDGLATIRPSIGVWDAACRSHYFITAGEVEWLPAFTNAGAASLMRMQIARHVASDKKRQSWLDRLRAIVVRNVDKLKSIFRTNRQ